MGHKQMFNTSQYFEIEQDWSHGHPASGQSYVHMGRAVSQENGSFFSSDQSYFNKSEGPQVYTPISGPPHDVFPHFSAGGNFYPPPELNYAQVHSNQYNRHGIHVVEGGLLDQTTSTGRGPFKRKGTGVSTSRERGGTSGIYSAGSTSNSFELHHEKPTSDYRNNFDSSGLPPYMSSSLSIGCEDSPRNVRSRSRLDLEPNPRRTHLLSYSSHPFSSTSHLRNHPGPVDASNLNADITAYEQPYWYSSSCTWEVSYLRLV
ncbi:uncharacterized protein LOC112328435 [Populus trichocarpa]|uniref:uncharacterized protein LOC112328435 n=1 Tax=Populus trichocarpa TaxID=3694 RepID=UPI000D188E01|nr:uncharacterized protein LOC112328435 [Populus trichocarpa]|eukprot:XP_024462729.1 uncharacterized protein LOC112328435 [Populus trichocarpa]